MRNHDAAFALGVTKEDSIDSYALELGKECQW